METFECILKRRSIRSYDKKDVPNEFIGKMLEAAIHAPSAGNLQPWEFIVVKDLKTKEELSNAALGQDHVKEAPVVIVVCVNPEKSAEKYGERGRNLYCIQDTAAAIQNMLLTATDLGLGTCWVGAFEEERVKDILRIPENLRPVALITVGFPISYEREIRTPRIPFENITWVEKYGEGFSWMETHGAEWKFKIEPIEKHFEKIKEKVSQTKD